MSHGFLKNFLLVKKTKDNIKNGNKILCGYRLPSLFFKKYWLWFSDPIDIKGADMVNFFSYNKIDRDEFYCKEGMTTVIDLNQGIEAIFSKMRNNFIIKQIRKGERNGIVIKLDKNFSEFKNIYYVFRKSKNLTKDNPNVLADNGILFSAYYNNSMIAGGIFISDGVNIRAWVLASLRKVSGSKDREIIGQANRMVITEAIKYAKNSGHKQFDLGGINPYSTDIGEKNLAEFKESFGGARIKCYYYYKVYSKLLKLLMRFRGFKKV
ncbi:MAG: hypothetical protein WCV69_02370 [Patescibacteria group bacterium]